jgi:hypothetical protein
MDTSPAGDYQSPFQTPLFHLPAFQLHEVLTVVFLFICLCWLVYTFIAAYHWFRYSHRSWLAFPAVAIHVVVSGAIIMYIATGI